jgi:hypothetical protein
MNLMFHHVTVLTCNGLDHGSPLRLPALFDLYIHPLKGIFYLSHHKIYSFPARIHSLYHTISTVGLLVILSKYIHVRSSFEVFIEINSMV